MKKTLKQRVLNTALALGIGSGGLAGLEGCKSTERAEGSYRNESIRSKAWGIVQIWNWTDPELIIGKIPDGYKIENREARGLIECVTRSYLAEEIDEELIDNKVLEIGRDIESYESEDKKRFLLNYFRKIRAIYKDRLNKNLRSILRTADLDEDEIITKKEAETLFRNEIGLLFEAVPPGFIY